MKPVLLSLLCLLFSAHLLTVQAQSFKWAHTYNADVAGVAADNQNNIVIAGNYNGTINLGADSITANNTAGYIAKYDSSGNNIWAVNVPDTGIIWVKNIATDINNNIYVCGSMSGRAIYFTNTDSMVFGGNMGSFIAKYDASGSFEWAARMDGDVTAETIHVDATGNILCGGKYDDSVNFSGIAKPEDSAYTNLFIAKYNPSGSILWVKNGKSVNNNNMNFFATDDLLQLTTDDNGNIYCTGYANGGMAFSNDTIVIPAYSFQAFVAKFDGNGNMLWHAVEGNVPLNIYKLSIAIDSKGNVYGGGRLKDSTTPVSHPFMIKYNNSGALQWLKKYTSTTTQYGITGIVTDSKDNVYITGDYGPQIALDTITLTSNSTSGTSIFVAKLDTGGNAIWGLTSYGAHERLNSLCMTMDRNSGNIAIAGGPNFWGADTLGTVILPPMSRSYLVYISNPAALKVPNVPHNADCVVYPNPATDELYIRNAVPGAAVKIYTVSGQAVYLGELNSTQETINVKKLPKGVYFIKMMTPDGVVQIKTFVKE